MIWDLVVAPQFDDHGQGPIGDERKRMRRVDRDRRQDRKQPIGEQLPQPGPIAARQCVMIEDQDAFGAQAFLQIRPASLLPIDKVRSNFRDGGQLLLRRQSIFALNGDAAGRQFFQAGDAHHVEFVEVAVGNRQEPHPLEERVTRIARLFENPFVKGEPRQLAIDVTLRRQQRRRCRGGLIGPIYHQLRHTCPLSTRQRIIELPQVHAYPGNAAVLAACGPEARGPNRAVVSGRILTVVLTVCQAAD